MQKKSKLIWLLGVLFGTVLQANPVSLLPIKIDLHDESKLQRGAKMYMNFCSGCHSLRYLRYNRMAQDIGLTTFNGEIDKDLLTNNLIFTSAKIYDPIQIAMPETDARQWFGVLPPDLSLTARSRGAAWIYTYLKSFYEDPKRPFGTNNLLIPEVAMPNVLEPLIGRIIFQKENKLKEQQSHLVLIEPGQMSLDEFDSNLVDLVTFLSYTAEPAKLIRYQIGMIVLLFLIVFWLVAYQLKRLYWKKIH